MLAIFALLAGKFYGLAWMDPLMGVVGAAIILRWAWSLIAVTANVLLDHQAPQRLHDRIDVAMREDAGVQVADLHVWAIGPGIYAAEVVVVTDQPRPPLYYKKFLPSDVNIVHSIVEVHDVKEAGPPPLLSASAGP